MKIILLMAVTADGMIARNSSHTIDWTGKEDKRYFVDTTKKSGVVIMGSKTFDMIGKPLLERKNIVMTRDKTRQSNDENLIFTDQQPPVIINKLHTQGFESVVLIGGAIVNTCFLRQNLIDEIHITIVPRLFGKGVSLFDKSLFDKSFDTKLELINVGDIGSGHVLLKYRINK